MGTFLNHYTNRLIQLIFTCINIGFLFITPLIGQPLSGTKTIGSGGDYTNFTNAVNALVTNGVSGPVIFNVISGSYNEQISIGTVSGVSATNTVTFRAQSGNASDVTIFYNPTASNNYVVDLNGANYITFRDMTILAQGNPTYGTVFRLRGNADNNNIKKCNLNGISTGSTGATLSIILVDQQSVDNFVADSNAINNGSFGLYFDGFNSSNHSKGIQFTNSTTSGTVSGTWIRYADGVIIRNNIFSNVTYRGIELNYCNGETKITKNRITGPSYVGIYLYGCVGGTGFPDGPGLIANNFVQGGSAYGIDLYSCSNQNVYYNSVNVTASNGYGYYGYNNTTNVAVQNNIFANSAGGYAVYYGNANGATTMDYNDLYTTGNFVGLYGTTATIDLDAWRTTSGKDANSVSYYPGFVSATDLHTTSPWLNGKATVFADVTDDIDGNARDGSTPDIGADEYTPSPGSTTPLSGTYTIGTGGTYTTFKSAVSDLLLKGVGGPVIFNVLNGTYNEHIVIYNVPGASQVNTITFQSQSGNPASAILYYPATSADSNYVVMMFQADHFRFKNLTFRANNSTSAQYGCVFNINGNVDNLILEGNRFESSPNSSSSTNYAIVNNNQAVLRSIKIIGNTFYDGGYAIYLWGLNSTFPCDSTLISGNTINNPDYTGINLQYHNSPAIEGNTIINANSRGIEVQYGNNGLRVVKNKIYDVGYIGIYIYSCVGGASGSFPPGLIANNFVHGKGSSYGIDIYSSSNQKIYHNSVHMTGATSWAYYGYLNNTNVDVRNNIFANSGGGYAVYFGSINGATSMDYNDLYTTGTYLGYTGSTNVTDIGAWQTATGKDGFSISINPQFYSATNLHVKSPLLDSAGVAVPEVTDDFDGEPRNLVKPDIGADEFSVIYRSVSDVKAGWNMISLPVTVTDNRKIVLYPTAISKAFAYSPSGYVIKDSLYIGTGYWLKFPSDYQNIISGYPKLIDTINVSSGWNLIGTIAYPLHKSLVVSNTTIISPYFGYSTSGYITIDTLKPGKAYWVKTFSAGNLILDVNNTKLKIAASHQSELNLEQMNQLTFSTTEPNDDNQIGTKLYFGTVKEKGIDLDQFSFPPLPPDGMTDVRFTSGRFVELFDADNLKEIKIPISIQGNNINFQLSWNIKQSSTRLYNLVEREGDKIISKHTISQTGSMIIKSNGKNNFTIESGALPSEITLFQNYPNPFNPTTTIKFTLPTSSMVSLKVFDILGREVASLVNEVKDPGEHSVVFDGNNLSSGIYIYQLKVNNLLIDSKRLLLIK